MGANATQTGRGNVDMPPDGALVYRHGFNILGWYLDDRKNARVESIVARIRGHVVGVTKIFYERPDVVQVHPDGTAHCGFEFLCTIPEGLRAGSTAQVELFAAYAGDVEIAFASIWVRYSAIDYRVHGHGYMLTDNFSRVLRRADVYGSGPPSPIADPRCAQLIMRYLDRSETVLDVGCGIGAYGRALSAHGYRWHGVEVVPEFCARMTAEGISNTLVSVAGMPFNNNSFDNGISIEVLEHIDDYEAFLAEIARVVRKTVCFSVPNGEGIPLMSYMHALPWHMLESDHKNFFSRGSLKILLESFFDDVEVFTYGELPKINAYDGIPIPNHLFAVASGPK